jgi:predicted N-acetyltransferase YhbS
MSHLRNVMDELKRLAAVGVVSVTTTMLKGIALLNALFVDPPYWRIGVGRVLFRAAVTRARALQCGALMIYAEPSAEGFYKRLGAIRIGEGPFYFSPDLILQMRHVLIVEHFWENRLGWHLEDGLGHVRPQSKQRSGSSQKN